MIGTGERDIYMNNTAQENGLRLLLIIIFLGATVFIGCKGEPSRLRLPTG
jgi:hypothetical protein